MAKLVVMGDPFDRIERPVANIGAAVGPPPSLPLAVAWLRRRLMGYRLTMLVVLSAARALSAIRSFAAVHPTVAVGVVAAMARLAMVFVTLVTLLSLAMVGGMALPRSLSTALMLGVACVLLVSRRLGRLR